ncbi:MFS general substrate transporter [Auriscalpium vulgare]|uniref:MFS general substrate transporter n=1 Tax=Auriscalpium vulgare TaxID=40419 RepID=A0ACB8S8J3_9AGAM|nr:MFS general substrate transporter [Auriscalpium vulgare]
MAAYHCCSLVAPIYLFTPMTTVTVASLRADGSRAPEDIELSLRPGLLPGFVEPDIGKGVKDAEVSPAVDVQSSSIDRGGADATRMDTQSIKARSKWTARIQMGAICWAMFLLGWNDGTSGPLLPRMQQEYHVNFFVVSLIFVANCVGIITGSLVNVYLNEKIGFGKILALGGTLSMIAYAIQAPAPPFPVFVLSYVLQGFSGSFMDAHANGYVVSLKNQSSSLGIAHSVYGIGAFAAPLVATQFSQMRRWSFQYLVSLGISTLNLAIIIAVFRFRTQNECLSEIGETISEPNTSSDNMYRQIFRSRTVHLFALFLLAYVGVEVTIGGWAVTYTIQVRHGGPASGYISSGFFGGLALGRVALLWVNAKLGNRRAVLVYVVLAIGLELVVWLVPSLISGAVSIALIGLILGPIFPIVMSETSKVVPRSILTATIGWIAAFGNTGSAALPLATGVLAQAKGIWTLQPLMISILVFMVILWLFIPKDRERID